MKIPFRNGHMLAPIIGTGSPMKIIEDFKKQMLAKQSSPKDSAIELTSKPEDLKVDPNKVQFNEDLIRDIAEAHAAWLNKEMFFILPKDLYELMTTSKKSEDKKKVAKWLYSKGYAHGYDSDDVPFQYGIWKKGERIALNTVHLEKVQE